MTINISLQDVGDNLHPKITVLGVGGSGGNAVNNMINANLEGVDFLIANTDAQALQISQYAELIFSSNVRIGLPKDDILSEKSIQNPGYSDVIGCSFFDYLEFSDEIIGKHGKKQKKQGFKGFFSWLDQYI